MTDTLSGCRNAFELAYNAKFNRIEFDSFVGPHYAFAQVNPDWIAFQKGWSAGRNNISPPTGSQDRTREPETTGESRGRTEIGCNHALNHLALKILRDEIGLTVSEVTCTITMTPASFIRCIEVAQRQCGEIPVIEENLALRWKDWNQTIFLDRQYYRARTYRHILDNLAMEVNFHGDERTAAIVASARKLMESVEKDAITYADKNTKMKAVSNPPKYPSGNPLK